MITYTNETEIHIDEKTVVSIGKFDGVHYGHQEIFNEMRKIREETGYKIAVFTFCSYTDPQLSTITEKRSMLEAEGVDYLIEFPFTDKLRTTSGEDFIRNLLVNKLNMAYIVAGDDCSFGYNKSGNAELLYKLSEQYRYKVRILDKLKADDSDISSTQLRNLLSSGDVEKIYDLKGSYYSVSGKVIKGKCFGKAISFPTANIMLDSDKLLPKPGVYATRTFLSGVYHDSMTNIGVNPTVDESGILKCETHIFDIDRELYNTVITIDFIAYIREEHKFDSIEELISQLNKDKIQSLQILSACRK